jgi:DNA-binding HxlR family transcriptional regulator
MGGLPKLRRDTRLSCPDRGLQSRGCRLQDIYGHLSFRQVRERTETDLGRIPHGDPGTFVLTWRGANLTATSDQRTVDGPSRALRADLDQIDHVAQALAVLQGKWKVHLLFFMARGVHRHSKLLECLPGASKKVMTDSLRGLERDGLVVRKIFPEVPARVEYSLTQLGWTLTEPLVVLAEWGQAHGTEVAAAQAQAAGNGEVEKTLGRGRAA